MSDEPPVIHKTAWQSCEITPLRCLIAGAWAMFVIHCWEDSESRVIAIAMVAMGVPWLLFWASDHKLEQPIEGCLMLLIGCFFTMLCVLPYMLVWVILKNVF